MIDRAACRVVAKNLSSYADTGVFQKDAKAAARAIVDLLGEVARLESSNQVPVESQSKTPAHLRDLADKSALKLRPVVQQAMLDAAAEIEGGEEAYAALVDENRSLREKLAQTQTNLRGAYDIIARRQV